MTDTATLFNKTTPAQAAGARVGSEPPVRRVVVAAAAPPGG